MDKVLQSAEELENAVNEAVGVLIYFSTPTCNVCKVLRPKIMVEFEAHFPAIERFYVDSTLHPEVASAYNVFAVPTMIVILDRKEFARESRNVSVAELVSRIERPYTIMNS